jgi:hypothetical protein
MCLFGLLYRTVWVFGQYDVDGLIDALSSCLVQVQQGAAEAVPDLMTLASAAS